MIEVRSSENRGRTSLGWLESRHAFSFGGYSDPDNVHFGNLIVINEDRVAPGRGFGMHGHADMEIISYVIEGALEHKDSLGTGSIIRPGDVQKMSAGSGIKHAEYNASKTEEVHFLQIWIRPARQGIAPSYQQIHATVEDRKGKLCLVASQSGSDNVIKIEQDAKIFASVLMSGDHVFHEASSPRQWIQVIAGGLDINGFRVVAGGAAAIEDEGRLEIKCVDDCHFLLFDLD